MVDSLAIEAPAVDMGSHQRVYREEDGIPDEVDGTAIVPIGDQANKVEVCLALSFTLFGIVGDKH